jgi:hypothetical protein
VNSRKKGKRGKQSLTVHLLAELAHLLALMGHLSLKTPDLFLELIDLHGEPSSHVLSLNL